MPLTEFQSSLAQLIATNKSEQAHLAGGAALHFSPQSERLSNDLDYFHDLPELVSSSFASDQKLLVEHGYDLRIELNQRGFVRAVVSKGESSTKVEWAYDSAFRFMPALRNPLCGFQLHPIDLAVNKVLALAGRDEPRDYLDALFIDREMLPLGAVVWAAVGKDPGFTPHSILELLKRRGRYQVSDFARLALATPLDPTKVKESWMRMLEEVEECINRLPPELVGCLFFDRDKRTFVAPCGAVEGSNVVPHFGSPAGVLPQLYSGDILADAVALLKSSTY
jgi:hypothetical protein